MLLKKKESITIVSIAVISFLVGTLFNMSFVVRGKGDGNPWNNVWTAISELQTRMDAIEQKVDQPRIERFVEPSESIVDSETWKVLASFTLTPNDSTNNVVLRVAAYMQYKASEVTPPEIWQFYWRAHVTTQDGSGTFSCTVGGITPIYREEQKAYTWAIAQSESGVKLGHPNQASYTIKFEASADTGRIVYLRNINIIVMLADGMPASN